jgi:hypothetical protein
MGIWFRRCLLRGQVDYYHGLLGYGSPIFSKNASLRFNQDGVLPSRDSTANEGFIDLCSPPVVSGSWQVNEAG